MKKKIKCKWCGKVFEYYKSTYPNRKFCLIVCRNEYFKKYRIGYCYNKKLQVKGGKAVHIKHPNLARENVKKSHIINKKNKTGFWDLKIQSMGGKAAKLVNAQSKAGKIGGKKAAETNRRNKTGFCYDSKLRVKGMKSNRKNKTSFWDSKLQSKLGKRGGKIGGINAQKTLRQNIRNLKYKGQYYDSPDEAGVSASLMEQFNYIPKEGKTLHIRMKGGEIDYLLEKLKLFIEYHPWFRNETEQEYYKRRRKVLNQNGYNDYSLIVIK